MKLRHSFFLVSALLAAATTANAFTYYWDSDSTNPGFGDTDGTWGTSTFWSTDSGGSGATANTATTTSDTVNFGTATDAYGTSAKTITLASSTKSVGAIVFGAAQTPSIKLSTTAMTNGNISLLGAGGSITVNAGSHLIEGNGTASSGTNRDLAFTTTGTTNVTFSIAGGSSLEIKGRIGGGNNVAATTYTKNGTGTLILSGFNGGTNGWLFALSTTGFTVSQGILRFAQSSATGNSANKYSVTSGAAIELDGGFTQNLATGTITLNGTGISSNGALRSLSGTNQISGTTGGIILNTHSSIGVDAGNLTLTGIISGASKNLTKVGAGALRLSGVNTYSGETTINGGTLNLGAGAATGSLASTVLNLGGGTLTYTRTGTNSQSFTTTNVTTGTNVVNNGSITTNTLDLGSIVRTAGSTLNIGATGTITTTNSLINGIIGGWAVLDNSGTITNWATHTGSGTDITGGLTYITTSGAGTSAGSYLNANIDMANSPGTIDAAINANSVRFHTNSANTLALNATGTNILQSGGILVTTAVGTNASTISGGNLAGAAGTDLVIHQLNTDASGALTISSNIVDNTSATGLTKTGGGTLILLDTSNSYTGPTAVNAGKLLINGDNTAATGAVTVASGATLGGTGQVGGNTTIQSGGTHAPGVAQDNQDFNGDLTYSSGSIFAWEIDTGSANTDSVTGTASGDLSGVGAVFNITSSTGYSDGFWNTNQQWTDIFSGFNTSADWDAIFTSISGTGLTWDGSQANAGTEGYFTLTASSLDWTAVPEPTSALAGLLLTAGLLRRRRF